MFAIYGCLLVLISAGLSSTEEQTWNSDIVTRFAARPNRYGASAGFKVTNIKDFPFMTSISAEPHNFPFGPGAILNKRWVLCTAYTSLASPEEFKLYTETNFAGRSGRRMNISKIIAHEKFKLGDDFSYNIAVLKTEQPITFNDKAKPVKLGNVVPKAGTDVNIISYGYLQNRPFVGWDIGVATVQVTSQSQCKQEHGTLKTAFCAEADGVEPCYGDVGTPLMYKNKLVGLYILGDYCKQLHKSEVYTNVPEFKKWIWKTIRANSNDEEMEGLSEEEFYED